jgi:OPA family glycerol-3-phosphate transporter-like MFS transporter
MIPSYVRQLDTYPTGRRRVTILAMAVLASLICSYEAQIAPVVPLLLHDLGMDLPTYGSISALAAIAGAVAGLIGGRLTDTVGRVRLLVPLMLLTSVLCFATTLVHSPGQLLAARVVLSFVDGVAVASTPAGLSTDTSQDWGRRSTLVNVRTVDPVPVKWENATDGRLRSTAASGMTALSGTASGTWVFR